MQKYFFILCSALVLSACTPPPPVSQSQAALWERYGHKSLDDVFLSWGAPDKETKLTNGSRLVTYRHATVNDDGSPYAYMGQCEASLLAPAPKYIVENIALRGDAYECNLLVKGMPGVKRNPYVPPPPMYPYGAYYR